MVFYRYLAGFDRTSVGGHVKIEETASRQFYVLFGKHFTIDHVILTFTNQKYTHMSLKMSDDNE